MIGNSRLSRPTRLDHKEIIMTLFLATLKYNWSFNRPNLLILQDPTTSDLLKPINIEKIMVAPEAQHILNQPDYDIAGTYSNFHRS